MKKKKLLIFIVVLVAFIAAISVGVLIYYDNSLSYVGGNKDIKFVIENGTPTVTVLENLEKEGLIKNSFTGRIYLKLNPANLQAGEYMLNTDMDFSSIIEVLVNGETIDNSISVTFLEGSAVYYQGDSVISIAKTISNNFSYTEEEVLNKLNDVDYLNSLIDKYWFITDDILNKDIKYPLEGYLAPNTYQFRMDASLDEIISKLLNQTDKILSKYKDEIKKGKYSVHELLTIASIVELEGMRNEDYSGIAEVIYNRLDNKAEFGSLGMDSTTNYAVGKVGGVPLYYDLRTCSPYNTRSENPCGFSGLPVGPIGAPGEASINAVFNPTNEGYKFFVGDNQGKTHFTKSSAEHNAKIAELSKNGLWFN